MRIEHRKENDEREGERRQWHLDRSFSVSNLLVALAMAGSGLYWGSGVDRRLALHDLEITAAKEALRIAVDATAANRNETRVDLLEINRKLDRIIERGQK